MKKQDIMHFFDEHKTELICLGVGIGIGAMLCIGITLGRSARMSVMLF